MAQVAGKVEKIIYRSPDSGFTVFTVTPGTGEQPALLSEQMTFVGQFMPAPTRDEEMIVNGEWADHPKFGKQLKVSEIVARKVGQTPEAMRAYLSSGIFPGIGPAKAAAIVAQFGEQTERILTHEPVRLAEVKGISPEKAGGIGNMWAENKASREVMTWLCGLGLSMAFAARIYKKYGAKTRERVTSAPYDLAFDISLIGFQRADEIARKVLPDWTPTAPGRLKAGIIHALKKATQDGHVYVPEQKLVERAADLLKIGQGSMQPIQAILAAMLAEPDPHIKSIEKHADKPIYLWKLYEAERLIARRLNVLAHTDEASTLGEVTVADAVRKAEAALSFELTDQQRDAAIMALSNRVSIITGGPGVGKTTILKLITDVLKPDEETKFDGVEMALCAPTGRAAKRLSEATDQPAATIHRLLEFGPDYTGVFMFQRHELNPLHAGMIIVDEASMLDTLLTHSLLKAIENGAHILFVGDVDQLPSVGAGNVLNDIIQSEQFPVARLSTIFRQAQQSQIVTNAHKINQGHRPDLTIAPDFLHVEIGETGRIGPQIVNIVCDKLAARGYDPANDVQVLAPMYRGDAGVNTLNQLLRARLNPPKLGKPERKFRPGDKVMQLRNDYGKGVHNGDVGFVEHIDKGDEKLYVRIDGRRVEYSFSDLNDLTLAYCCTVHKSQGSEYPVVVMVVSNAHYIMLRRNLLYTGITRGKRLVITVGTKKAIGIATNRADDSKRWTGLTEFLKAGQAQGQNYG